MPKSQDDNLTSSVYSFSGNRTLNGMKVSTNGMVSREDGTSSITNGRAFFTSENGRTSYSCGGIIDIEGNVTRHLGAAFFDANATGNLEFLKSIIGVYKALIARNICHVTVKIKLEMLKVKKKSWTNASRFEPYSYKLIF